jgi:UDP-GlcNAc:undecaprenyl-phosphate/decaprenyl-phosphate GlcNAc-1-phosphate transferase
VGVYVAFWIAFFVSATVAAVLVATTRFHGRWTADTLSGPQKIHSGHIPRVGGVAIGIGFCVSLALTKLGGGEAASVVHLIGLVAALLVPFFAGLYEDITKQFGASLRLIATFIAAAIAYYACDAAIIRFNMPLLDAMLGAAPIASLLFTMFCVGGVAHAFNLSDGLNGLLAGLTIAASAVLAITANSLGDLHVLNCALALAGATAGFVLFNVPKARLFAGDSGAYVTGTAVALLAIMLVARNPGADPWIAFIAVLYPFTDATCAIIRRLVRRKPIMEPDAEHLHTLLAKRLARQSDGNRHMRATMLILSVVVLFQGAALAFGNTPRTAVLVSLAFALFYAWAWRHLSHAATLQSHKEAATQVSAPR